MDEEIMENNAEMKEDREKTQRRDYYVEIILMLILGILVGIAAKTEANKRIAIGSDDYRIKSSVNAYNLNEMEKELSQNREEAQKTEEENTQTTPADGADYDAN